jgi:hypothetical protein
MDTPRRRIHGSVVLGSAQIACALGHLFEPQARPPYLSVTDDRTAGQFLDAVKSLAFADNVDLARRELELAGHAECD